MLCILLFSGLVAVNASAKTHLPLPRFVSVSTSEANIRTGPGLRYRIKWILKRKHMPVEIVSEFEQWRKVRDIEGAEGWVHRSQLSSKRTAMVIGETQIMREKPSKDSAPVARIETTLFGQVERCKKSHCLLVVKGYRGWLNRNNLWGVYPNETLD